MSDLGSPIEVIRFLRSLTDELIVWMISLIGGYHAIRHTLCLRKPRKARKEGALPARRTPHRARKPA